MLSAALLASVWALLAAKALGGRMLAWRQRRLARWQYQNARQAWERISARAVVDCRRPEGPIRQRADGQPRAVRVAGRGAL